MSKYSNDQFSTIAYDGDIKSPLDTRLADGILTICFGPDSLAMRLGNKFEAELRERCQTKGKSRGRTA